MVKNNILDYEQAEDKMQSIAQNGIIKELEPLASTTFGLPIRHFTVGNGSKDIVITGTTHGSEIISADFVIKLMDDIDKNTTNWEQVLDNFKIHFVPILNPEGYLISTSAIRKLIPEDMSQDEAEKICKEYYKIYRSDTTDPDLENNLKRHQTFFEGIDYNCIPDKYERIKNKVKDILEKYPDLPKWCLHIWSSNANGIDIQANSKFNPQIKQILNGESLYMKPVRFNNIDVSHPGPLNCPFDKNSTGEFKIEPETQAISNLLDELHSQDKLFAYLNYHSTGGMIFQRPATPPEELNISQDDIAKKEIQNYMFARLYSHKTYKNRGIDEDGIDKKEKTPYTIQKGKENTTSSNDLFRLLYPQDLLIELSPMGGNPIAPYGDLDGNYANSINSNLDAVKHTLKTAGSIKMISENFYKNIQCLKDKGDYEQVTSALDMIYNEFSRRFNTNETVKTNNLNRKDTSEENER